jgi:hypothetical protein
MGRLCRMLKHFPVALLWVAVTIVIAPAAAIATPPPVWGAGDTTSLPSGAVASGVQISTFDAVACGSSSACVAVGYYIDADGYEAVVAPVSDGVLGTAMKVSLPAGATTVEQHAELNSVVCTSATSCVAVGQYSGPDGGAPLVVPVTDGIPGTASTSTLPSGALTNGNQQAYLGSVVCATATACEAAGDFQTAAGTEALLVSVNNGTAGASSEPALPAGALPTNQDAYLNGVSCASQTSCLAVGAYVDGQGYEPLAIPIASGSPGTPVGPVLPLGAKTTSQSATLNSVSCAPSDACVAVGSYDDSHGSEALVVPITDGSPGTAYTSSLPAGAKTSSQEATFNQISCAPAGACLAVGDYEDATVGGSPLAVPVTNGVPGAPITVPLPAGQATFGGDLDSVSCVATSVCVAAGYYFITSGYEAFTVPVASGTAGTPVEVAAPTAQSSPPHAEIDSISCPAAGTCVGAGQYGTSGDGDQLLAVDSQPQLSISTSTLPVATVDVPYSVSLSAIGAETPYSWSISSGELPAGLELDPATGTISGTPTADGSQSFGVTVASSGAPSQHATAPLSLQVAAAAKAAPIPVITLRTHSAVVTSGHAKFSLQCKNAPCVGTLTLETTKLVRVHHDGGTSRKRETVLLAVARYKLAKGRTAALSVHLRRQAQVDLARARNGVLKVTAVVKVSGGVQVHEQVALHRSRQKRRTRKSLSTPL